MRNTDRIKIDNSLVSRATSSTSILLLLCRSLGNEAMHVTLCTLNPSDEPHLQSQQLLGYPKHSVKPVVK